MSAILDQHLHDYLTIRRSVGFNLDRTEKLLGQFLDHLADHDLTRITTDAAIAWASTPEAADTNWWAQRLSVVRCFARHLHVIDPSHEVPPPGVFPTRANRAVPYIYTDAEISALMAAAARLRSPLRATTHETLIGLLAVTGLRIGEALSLDRSDFDPAAGVLHVRNSKFNKSRHVPILSCASDALAAYGERRDNLCPTPVDPALFLSTAGTRLLYCNFHHTWLGLIETAGLPARSGSCRPRPHDLRHRFAVVTLQGWYRDGVDVQANLALLSTYLGHTDVAHTYWYLTGTPELLAIIAERLDNTGPTAGVAS
ncbi:MAG: tyrosine-type recombinase/integrase [Candidatus Microthrix subdominans]|jgi:integrase/recombinase XerD